MATKKHIDPIFAEYARTAPRLDLQFYLACAERDEQRGGIWSAQTAAIVRDMAALYVELSRDNAAGTPATQKRRVWALLDQYKLSCRRCATPDEPAFWAHIAALEDATRAMYPTMTDDEFQTMKQRASTWPPIGAALLTEPADDATAAELPIEDDEPTADANSSAALQIGL